MILTNNKDYKHKKTGLVYKMICNVTNTTNTNDGQEMILYMRDDMLFVREKQEFLEKFEVIK